MKNGPYTTHHSNDRVHLQVWYKDGEFHREGNPAVIEYDQNGQIESEEYYVNGEMQKRHVCSKQDTLDQQIIEIQGRKYKLVLI